jgi:hypothetical protein
MDPEAGFAIAHVAKRVAGSRIGRHAVAAGAGAVDAAGEGGEQGEEHRRHAPSAFHTGEQCTAWRRHRDCSHMPTRPAIRRESPARTEPPAAEPVRHRHGEDARAAFAPRDGTASASGLVARWKQAVVDGGDRLVQLVGVFAALDLLTATSECFVPVVSPLLNVARIGVLAVLVPAVLRMLAIRHADHEDAELLKAIAVAFGLATLYVVVRTGLVVGICAL